jgi:hypothetical protein
MFADHAMVLDRLARRQDTARTALATLLERTTLGSDLASLRSQVGPRFRGWGTSKDVVYVNRQLRVMLTHVRDGTYDFTKLDGGIHEFRRQLRWFPLTIDSLDGLVLVRDDPPGHCPVPALEALAGSAAARNKYANPSLRYPAPHACTVSRCLLWQVAKTVRDLGRLKDEAEGTLAIEWALDEDVDISSTHDVTPAEFARATSIRAELNSTRTLDVLIGQLSSCKP